MGNDRDCAAIWGYHQGASGPILSEPEYSTCSTYPSTDVLGRSLSQVPSGTGVREVTVSTSFTGQLSVYPYQ